MTLIDIDDVAARERLREIAAANKTALDARVRQAAELTEQAREAFEREEAEHKAALARKAEADAHATKVEQQEQQEKPKTPPKPTTLSLGAEEFKLAREASRALEAGARDEQDDATKQDKPARKRPPRPETDDDMSGRTWLR
jgi:hypothetical protein